MNTGVRSRGERQRALVQQHSADIAATLYMEACEGHMQRETVENVQSF